MRGFAEFVERPLATTVILLGVSTVAGVSLFILAGSVAEVTGQSETIAGLTIRAAGPFGGALILFYVCNRTLTEQRRTAPMTRMPAEYALRAIEAGLDPTDDGYVCEYRLYDRRGGGWGHWKKIDYTRDGNTLRIWVKEMAQGDLLQVQVSDKAKNRWRSVQDQSYGVTFVSLQKLARG